MRWWGVFADENYFHSRKTSKVMFEDNLIWTVICSRGSNYILRDVHILSCIYTLNIVDLKKCFICWFPELSHHQIKSSIVSIAILDSFVITDTDKIRTTSTSPEDIRRESFFARKDDRGEKEIVFFLQHQPQLNGKCQMKLTSTLSATLHPFRLPITSRSFSCWLGEIEKYLSRWESNMLHDFQTPRSQFL